MVGDRRRIKFCEDDWCGSGRGGTLKEMFPNLSNLGETKGAFLSEVWDSSTGEGVWNPILAEI